jgi:hypothetical protein
MPEACARKPYRSLSSEKLRKVDAGYQDCGDSGRICAICGMFREANNCTLVAGFISRTGTCNHFEKAAA